MITTSTHASHAGPTTSTVVAGIAVAIALQVLAAGAAIGSMVIVLAAAFANYGSYGAEQESTWWVIFAVPLAIAAVVTYVMSGFAASQVMRTGLGWLTLLTAPSLLVLLTAIS
jgi:hypothetical protein